MDDVQGLYIVTGVVLVGLFGWVAAVLARAPKAVDESKRAAPSPSGDGKPASRDEPAPADAPARSLARPPSRDQVKTVPDLPGKTTPAPAPVLAPAPEPAPAPAPARAPEPAHQPPVVVLPPIRQRLDSHPEIQDSSPANAPIIVMPGAAADTKPKNLLALVTAIGRSNPEPGKQPERDAIIENDHLFVFADGGGRKAGTDLVGAIAVDALTQAFAKDEASAKTDDPKLSARANRVRRAVLAANMLLLKRARAMAFAGLGASAFVAHFSPRNDELFVARVGANRAYRLRGGKLEQLTSTAKGTRQAGLVERVEVETVTIATEPNDVYLFCSDGLAKALGDATLADALGADSSLEEKTKRIIASVSAKEGGRNQLAILVRVESTSPAPAPAPEPEPEPERLKTVRGLG